MKKYFLLPLVALFLTVPAWATWEFANGTTASSSNPQITDGNWTLYLNSKSKVKYKSHAGGSTVLNLSDVQTDTGLTITMLDNEAFKGNTVITELICPPTCTTFWTKSFNSCKTIQKIGIPSDFTTFNGDNMFDSATALKTIYILGKTPEEGTVALPATVKTLNPLTFAGCTSIEKVVASGVVDVGNRTFAGMTSLEQVVLSPNLAVLRTNSSNWNQSAFYGNGPKDAALVDFSPSVFSSSFVMATNNPTSGGNGMFAYTGITNYIDMSECTFDTIPSLAFSWVPIAGATIPASVTTIKDQAFKQNTHSATFRFLGAPPTFDCQGQNTDNVPFRNSDGTISGTSYNVIGTRHVFIVDAETYPAWTNQYFVSVADIKTSSNNEIKKYQDAVNNPTDSSYDFPTPEHPEETLGITNYGHRPNEYAWIVQYVDHSTVTVTWMNGDQEFSAATSVEIGDAPTAPAGTPAKESTAELEYTFVGWNTDPNATTALDLSQLSLTANTTFYAIYSSATRSYEITWKRDAETVIDTTTVLYGVVPTHADASKPSDGTYSYRFDGWSEDGLTVLASLPAVTGAATYIAVFTPLSLDTSVTVSWFDEDGTTPLDPAQTTVEKGAKPTHAEPSKAATIDTTYTFAGWKEVGGDDTVYTTANLPVATADVSYKAYYASSVRQYTVTFADYDGTVITAIAYDYGTEAANVTVPADPMRAADAEYTYTFAGWSPSTVSDVTGEATYTATYTETANTYTATFVNEHTSETISTADFAYGSAVTAPQPPEVEGYTFTEWSPAIETMPASNTTYTAIYEINAYTITWVNGVTGVAIGTTSVNHGDTPTHADASQSTDTKASYAFVGWSPEIEAAVSNTTYTAVFNATFLTPMSLLYVSASNNVADSVIEIAATVTNYTTGATQDSASLVAKVGSSQVDGNAEIAVPSVAASIADLAHGKGYEWTLTAMQQSTYVNGTDTATLYGRTYARKSRTWLDDAAFAEGVVAPASSSEAGSQVRLRATMSLADILPRALTNDTKAVVGIAPYQTNAGTVPAWYAWNGSAWVRLYGATPAAGSTAQILGVVDFARKVNGVVSPAVAWYIDGYQMMTADGNWEVDLVGGSQLSSFAFTGDSDAIGPISADYDVGGGGFFLFVR